MKRISLALLAALMAVPVSAFAQEPVAASQVARTCGFGSTANLASTTGDVLLSRGAGFSEIRPGANLLAGDRVLVRQGSASLALGSSCLIKLGPNSMVSMSERDGVLYADRVSSDPKVVGAGLPSPSSGAYPAEQIASAFDPGLLVGAGALAAVGVGVGIAVSQHSHSGPTPFLSF